MIESTEGSLWRCQTSYWHVDLDGIKLNRAAVGAAPSLSLVLKPISQLTHHGRDVSCCFVELVDHHLVQPGVHRRFSVADNDV